MQTLPDQIPDLTDQLADCRYCSEVSKASGEDPIGSAPRVDYWLIVEISQPWPTSMFTEHPIISQMFPLLKQLAIKRGLMVRPIAIAPDPDYSTPETTRVLYYCRPKGPFATFDKTEYLLPNDQAADLVLGLLNRLLGKGIDLTKFATYQQDTQHLRELLVCTHTQVDLACGRFGTPLYRQLRKTYGPPGADLRVWQSTHFGGHHFAPTLVDLPTGQFWGHLTPEVVPQLIHRSGDPQPLAQCYRGWAGVNRFEQIAERAIWLETGWDWFTRPRTAQAVSKGLAGKKRWLYPLLRRLPVRQLQLWLERWTSEASWAEVEVGAKDRQGCLYRVRIEADHEVMTAHQSVQQADQKIFLEPVTQYRVKQIAQCP